MKRFKNLVIGGIQNKVFNLILLTVILLTAAFSAVSLYHANMLEQLALESNQKMLAAIQEKTEAVIGEADNRPEVWNDTTAQEL